tara:strand:- start:401 stop:1204 length:804 start_codon:yes stop_codon:yes gene_type:complete
MKLAVSNIAWKNNEFNKFYELLASLNCSGVEIAPSKIWNNIPDISKENVTSFLSDMKKNKLEFLGFHSLLYGRKDLQLFKNDESRINAKNFLFKLIELCSKLNGKNLVFGSPKNRNTFDNKNADEIGKIFFDEIANYAKKYGVFICIEPLDISMTNFLNSIQETGKFIQQVGNPNLKLHIDTKSFLLSKESIENNILKFSKIIKHVHISDKDLNELNNDAEVHRELANSLIKINYNDYLSLEMRRIENNEINSIKNSVKFIKDNYLN